jgi:tetratricopeptide (TPR) repeat protein
MDRLDDALEYHNKALDIDEKELNDRVEMAGDYYNMNFVYVDAKKQNANKKQEALKCLSKALEILEEFKEKTNYHHPLNYAKNIRYSQTAFDAYDTRGYRPWSC